MPFLNAAIPLVLVLLNTDRMDLSKEILENLASQRAAQVQPPFDSCNRMGVLAFLMHFVLSKSIPISFHIVSGDRS